MNRNEAFKYLKSINVRKVIIDFSGGGDEGGVDQITLYEKGGERNINEWTNNKTWNNTKKCWELITPPSIEHELSVCLCKPIYDKYNGFAGNFYVSGQLTWNVKDKSVKISGKESEEVWDDIEEDL